MKLTNYNTIFKSQTLQYNTNMTRGTRASLNSLSRRLTIELLWWTTSKKLVSGRDLTSPPGITSRPNSGEYFGGKEVKFFGVI